MTHLVQTAHTATLIFGDGIGPEVVQSAVDIIEAARVKISWDVQLLGLEAIDKYNTPVPPSTLESIKQHKVALKGPTTTPVASGHSSANVTLRKALDLYACVRPVRSIPCLESRFSDINLVVIRENTEGLYVGQEFEVQPGCVISLRTMTQKACTRIAQAAYSYATNNNYSDVCVVHKANILKLGDGLWLKNMRNVAKEYKNITTQEVIIDALCMKLVIQPQNFQILVLENMFGDIVSDLCAGLVGGLGLVPGANIGDMCAVFEAVHGSAPDIAHKNLANPTAMIQSAVMMLRYLNEHDAAGHIEKALFGVLQEKALRTRDLGGNLGTREFSKEVIARL
jgi:isocitrate dehydrogenase (NAD+)